jgi:excisionase family DNA binding protein
VSDTAPSSPLSGSPQPQTPRVRPVPRLALTPSEAAEALGVSRDSFDRHIAHELRLVRRGRLVLVPVSELEAWLSRSAAKTVE